MAGSSVVTEIGSDLARGDRQRLPVPHEVVRSRDAVRRRNAHPVHAEPNADARERVGGGDGVRAQCTGGRRGGHTWDVAALLLRPHYHLIALDQRGHGDTE